MCACALALVLSASSLVVKGLKFVEPSLEGGVEAKVVDELLQRLVVLRLCVVERDLHLAFAVLVFLLKGPDDAGLGSMFRMSASGTRPVEVGSS